MCVCESMPHPSKGEINVIYRHIHSPIEAVVMYHVGKKSRALILSLENFFLNTPMNTRKIYCSQ